MSTFNCDARGCGNRVVAHFLRVQNREAVDEGHLCNIHASDFLDSYDRSAKAKGLGALLRCENGASFDPELLLFDDVGDQRGPLCQVFLVETGGTRRVPIAIGPFEGQALRLELQRYEAPRPMTHRAMAAAIIALGGLLRQVVIDKFSPAQRLYEAKLHIQQMNTTVIVDVRPSDAVILAIICGVPIIVSDDVYANVAGTRKDRL